MNEKMSAEMNRIQHCTETGFELYTHPISELYKL